MCKHGFIGACSECDGAGQVPDRAELEAAARERARKTGEAQPTGDGGLASPSGTVWRMGRRQAGDGQVQS